GRSISALMEQLGVEATFVNGQRITNEAGLRVAEMVLSGSVNKLLTLALLEAGVDAMGLSGVDRGLLRAERWAEAGSPEDMGRVGGGRGLRGAVRGGARRGAARAVR